MLRHFLRDDDLAPAEQSAVLELAKTMKADTRVAHVPIIIITSRTAEKHRARAKELGVEAYLGKPYQEEELLKQLRSVLALHTA